MPYDAMGCPGPGPRWTKGPGPRHIQACPGHPRHSQAPGPGWPMMAPGPGPDLRAPGGDDRGWAGMGGGGWGMMGGMDNDGYGWMGMGDDGGFGMGCRAAHAACRCPRSPWPTPVPVPRPQGRDGPRHRYRDEVPRPQGRDGAGGPRRGYPGLRMAPAPAPAGDTRHHPALGVDRRPVLKTKNPPTWSGFSNPLRTRRCLRSGLRS